jgi:hypothetical protein
MTFLTSLRTTVDGLQPIATFRVDYRQHCLGSDQWNILVFFDHIDPTIVKKTVGIWRFSYNCLSHSLINQVENKVIGKSMLLKNSYLFCNKKLEKHNYYFRTYFYPLSFLVHKCYNSPEIYHLSMFKCNQCKQTTTLFWRLNISINSTVSIGIYFITIPMLTKTIRLVHCWTSFKVVDYE